MEIEIKFKSNFLSRQKRSYGALVSLSVVAACLFMSLLHWSPNLGLDLSVSLSQITELNQYYRLFTASFAHGDLKHLTANIFMLLILTYFVSSFYGVFYSFILSFLSGAIINFAVISIYGPSISLVGASGIIYYLWGFWLVLFLFIERQQSLVLRLLKVFGIFLILLVPTTYSPSTSYLAHYIGFGVGVFNGLGYYIIFRKYLHSFEVFEYRIVNNDLEEKINE